MTHTLVGIVGRNPASIVVSARTFRPVRAVLFCTGETRTIGSLTWTTQVSYDALDRVTSITYPTGEVVPLNDDVLRNAVWLPVVGNHELHRPSRVGIENFRRYVHCDEDSPRPELDYTMRYGNVRMVLANAFEDWSSTRMRTWLDGQLSRARAEGPDDFLLVVLHWGMHSSGPHGENQSLRAAGMPDGVAPVQAVVASEPWPAGDEAISHLIAVSMDAWGEPIGLFACNRWVTGETWYAAEDVIRMLDRFEIDHAWPSWPANRWLGAMLRLYRPWIEGLLRHRDAVVRAWQCAQPGADVFEDRALEITGYLPVSVPALMTALEASLDAGRLDEQGTPDRSER